MLNAQPTAQPTASPRAYAKRPIDQQYTTVGDLVRDAQSDRDASKIRNYNLRDLHAIATADNEVQLESPRGVASFTHWSFSQLAGVADARADYMRYLPAKLAADCINYGLSQAPIGTQANILVKTAFGQQPIARAVQSQTYGFVFDCELYSAIQDTIADRDGWEVQTATRSDRDSTLTITNKRYALSDPSVRSIVNDPAADVSRIMYRSLTIGNSETGRSSIWYDAGLFVARCKNLQLFSFSSQGTFRRRHTGENALRDSLRAIWRLAREYAHQSGDRDEAIIRGLVARELASTKDAIVDELRKIGATKEQAESAYDRCERTESASPRSFWGIAQGLTRISQDSGYQDSRIELDRLAAVVLARGAKLVAA